MSTEATVTESTKPVHRGDRCRLGQIPVERIAKMTVVSYGGRVRILKSESDETSIAIRHHNHRELELELQCGHWCTIASGRDYVAMIVKVRA